VRRAEDVATGDRVQVTLADGELSCRIEEKTSATIDDRLS
jgi:exonuclease VII large subunit